jgi:hypothetical protein
MQALTSSQVSHQWALRGLFIGEIKGRYYNVRNAPIQPLYSNTAQSRGHYGPLIFTNISMPNQSWPDTCPLLGQLHPKATSDLRPPARPLNDPRNLWLGGGRPDLRSDRVSGDARDYPFLQNESTEVCWQLWYRRRSMHGVGLCWGTLCCLCLAPPTVRYIKCIWDWFLIG